MQTCLITAMYREREAHRRCFAYTTMPVDRPCRLLKARRSLSTLPLQSRGQYISWDFLPTLFQILSRSPVSPRDWQMGQSRRYLRGRCTLVGALGVSKQCVICRSVQCDPMVQGPTDEWCSPPVTKSSNSNGATPGETPSRTFAFDIRAFSDDHSTAEFRSSLESQSCDPGSMYMADRTTGVSNG